MERDATRWGRPVYHKDRYGFTRFVGTTGTGRPQRKRRQPAWKRGERRARMIARIERREMKMAARE